VHQALVGNVGSREAMRREKAQARIKARLNVPMRFSVTDRPVVATKRGNACRAKGAGHPRHAGQRETGMTGGGSLQSDDTSRMRRESHVRICEGLGVRFPGATRRFAPAAHAARRPCSPARPERTTPLPKRRHRREHACQNTPARVCHYKMPTHFAGQTDALGRVHGVALPCGIAQLARTLCRAPAMDAANASKRASRQMNPPRLCVLGFFLPFLFRRRFPIKGLLNTVCQ
jgi:hypothetical protein